MAEEEAMKKLPNVQLSTPKRRMQGTLISLYWMFGVGVRRLPPL